VAQGGGAGRCLDHKNDALLIPGTSFDFLERQWQQSVKARARLSATLWD
jgi:hypothetical protein